MRPFNREILALAREARGFTQVELSQILNIEQGTISKIENGTLAIPEHIEKIIPEVLDFPVELFYTDKKVIKVEGHYRKKVSLPVKESKKYRALMTMVEWNINTLSDAVNFPPANIPSWDIESEGMAAAAARYVREYWKIPRGRIDDLATIMEDNGIIIAPLDLDNMDGLSTYSSEYNLPIVYINRKRPADRTRFNLAHELLHYVSHFGKKISDGRDIEAEANEFASELLMPSNEIQPQLMGNLTIEKLADLKRYWKVSMQAILVKAKSLGMVTDNQYKYLWRQMGALGYRTTEPVTIAGDQISMLKELVNMYVKDFGYTKEELAKTLYLTPNNLEVIYFGGRPKPRLHFRSAG
jgi:Zn-dependent peptidase ImmA (M78 family)/transcriptional regulator with XRE-family HTH domain